MRVIDTDALKEELVRGEWNFYNDVIVMLGGEDGEPDGEKEL